LCASLLIMRRVLHILTRPDDALAREVMARQKNCAANKIEAVDLTQPAPDYKELLGKIFAADSIECW
jgi:hypothetical protein